MEITVCSLFKNKFIVTDSSSFLTGLSLDFLPASFADFLSNGMI